MTRGNEHDRDAQRFDDGADERVVDGDPHLAAVVLLSADFSNLLRSAGSMVKALMSLMPPSVSESVS